MQEVALTSPNQALKPQHSFLPTTARRVVVKRLGASCLTFASCALLGKLLAYCSHLLNQLITLRRLALIADDGVAEGSMSCS